MLGLMTKTSNDSPNRTSTHLQVAESLSLRLTARSATPAGAEAAFRFSAGFREGVWRSRSLKPS